MRQLSMFASITREDLGRNTYAAKCKIVAGQLRPHILLIVLDDAGFNDFEWGANSFATPSIARLKTEGVTISKHYVCTHSFITLGRLNRLGWPQLTFSLLLGSGKAMPLCAPSRFSLFSGRHPGLFGMNFVNIKPTDGISFPPKEITMPEKFKMLGYSTLGFGKVCSPMISLPRYVYLLPYNNCAILSLSFYAVASRPCQS